MAGTGRTLRRMDLCRAVGADTYLCGTGGARYVEQQLLADAGINLRPFSVPGMGGCADLQRRALPDGARDGSCSARPRGRTSG
ncbi:WbqC family protein [Streptomyces sp. NPDC050848]|uniref:WbqC family protein n=1 Tax=Streptomyces sp. NPDC050848 TaxID=3155791 RepID=UPI0033F9B0A7